MRSFTQNLNSERFSLLRIYLVSVLFLLFLVRLALPQYVKYILFPLLAATGIFAFVIFIKVFPYRKRYLQLKVFIPVFLTIIIYIIAFILTPAKQEILVRDFVNVLGAFAFLFILMFLINSENEQRTMLRIFKTSVIWTSTLVALAGLIKLYFQLLGTEFEFLKVEVMGYPGGSSLAVDRNFFTLICVFGIILNLPGLFEKRSLRKSLFTQISLLILLANIFLSTSRRGVIIAFSISLVFIVLIFLSLVVKSEELRRFRKNSTWLAIASIFLFMVMVYWLVIVPPMKRNKSLAFSKFDQVQVHSYVNWMTLSIKSIFRGETVYQEIHNNIWKTNFNPRYPYSGWAKGNYTVVAELTGENVGIVPDNAMAAKIDKNVGNSSWGGNAYYFSELFNTYNDHRKRYLASIYCYVSPDFNGDWVRISSHRNVSGLTSSYYDMEKKGRWQKLISSFYADTGSFATYLYMSRLNAKSFDSLDGHVLFAYPELREINFDPRQPISWTGSPYEDVVVLPGPNADIVPEGSVGLRFSKSAFQLRDSLLSVSSQILVLDRNKKLERNVITIFAYVSEDFNGDEVGVRASGNYHGLGVSNYDLSEKGVWKKMILSVNSENNINIILRVRKISQDDTDTLNGYVIFAHPEVYMLEYDPKDPITWSSQKYIPMNKIKGVNSEIIPFNTIGCLIDKTSTFYKSRASGNYHFSSRFERIQIQKAKRYITSIYCFVSEDFNGAEPRLCVRGNVFGSKTDNYDFKRKGTWQKLFLNNYGDSGYIEPYLYFSIPGKNEAKWLKGHVIFAYPESKIFSDSPANPDSYSRTIFTREFPLAGRNSELLPPDVAGYRLDNKTGGKIYGDLCYSATDFLSIPVSAGDSVYASVFCYVSEEFDGNEASLRLRGNLVKNTTIKYDSKMKGSWVKLEARAKALNDGRTSGVLFFSKKDVTDFSNLKGHVTFAYPVLKVIKSGDKALSHNVRDYGKKIMPLFKASLFSFSQNLNDSIVFTGDSLDALPEFRKEMTDNKFIGPRLDRWKYALYIFKNEYNPAQKLIGKGFGFTKKFATVFGYQESDYDYPHNPFLSVLLYSGIAGFLVYLWFILKAVHYYWIYRKEYWSIGLCFLAALFFSFFSSNNPFEPAIAGILAVLPYIIHYNHIRSSEGR